MEKKSEKQTKEERSKEKHAKVTEKAIYIKTIDGSLVRGKVNIGTNDRLSDVFVKGKYPFVVLFDVGQQGNDKKVLIINKNHIVWVEPDEAE